MVFGLFMEQAEAIFKNFTVDDLIKLDENYSLATMLEITKNKASKISEQKLGRGQGNMFANFRQNRNRS